MKKTFLKKIARLISLGLAVSLVFQSGNGKAMAGLAEGNAAESGQRENPLNPVHHCGMDASTFSYVWFGSYPQHALLEEELTVAITTASYDENGDAEVGGKKYRRVCVSGYDDNNDDDYNYYENRIYRYFLWEPIKWKVLQKEEGTLYLMADQALDVMKSEFEKGKWSDSSMRQWLNQDFYEAAFESGEREAIEEWEITTGNEYTGIFQTHDNVYLLPFEDAENPAYGFCSNTLKQSTSRRVKNTDYADELQNANYYVGYALLPDVYDRYVDEFGKVCSFSLSGTYLCVPALRLNTSCGLWTAEDGVSGEEALSNPVHHCWQGLPDNTDYSYIYFGSYPQSQVAPEDLTDAIIEADYNENGDAWADGIKYRRRRRADWDEGDYDAKSKYHYFKWERIKWRVLQNDGEKLFIMADQSLGKKDCIDADERNWYLWKNSKIRHWLNREFLGQAFSAGEQAAIADSEVKNEDNPVYGTLGGETTTDKVFLLSYGEVTNPKYGFCEYESFDENETASRKVMQSEYVGEKEGTVNWMLRTPGKREDISMRVLWNGDLKHINDQEEMYEERFTYGIVPALCLDISSELWLSEDDGTSGEGGNDGVLQKPINGSQQIAPSNPIHRCDPSVTYYSYIYFGSYPQSEVKGEALTPEITGAAYDERGDALAGGIKYRRISRENTEVDTNFGDQKYRYFKWEPVKWRVLENDGESMLVVADRAVDCKKYKDGSMEVTWENSLLRKWMNGEFYQEAFQEEEREAILTQYLAQSVGNDTKDKVFTPADESVMEDMHASEYAYARGIRLVGSIYVDRAPITGNMAAVPSLRLKLFPAVWTMAGSAWDKEDVPSNPVHHYGSEEHDSYFDIIYFGSYPQSRVPYEEQTEDIVNAAYDKRGSAWVNGVKYQRTGSKGFYRYYKWERIKWRVLQTDGDTMLVSAASILDQKIFSEKEENRIWEKSDIRRWLNKDFCGKAFSEREQKEIVKQTLVNEDNYFMGTEGGADTEDYVFLLSFGDVTNPQYGFCCRNTGVGRDLLRSEYAEEEMEYTDYNNFWFLRSPGSLEHSVLSVNRQNGTDEISDGFTDKGIVPTLRLKIANNQWSSVNDGTSGDGGNGGVCMIGGNGQDSDQKPGGSSDQKPGGSSGQKPGGSSDQKPSGSSDQKPGKTPNQDTGSKDEETENRKPEAGNIQKPTVVPKKTSISGKIKAKPKGFLIKWKKKKSVTGYQIQYSISRKFTKKTTKIKTVKKASAGKLTVRRLKAKKKYYVRVRTYCSVKGKKYYSGWSKAKSVRTK